MWSNVQVAGSEGGNTALRGQVDGYDKLKPYGFCIHGAIDGYSRRIMWLEVGRSNNNSRVIASYFLGCVNELSGVPRIISGDQGTEKVNVADMQCFFRRDAQDDFAGQKSFLYGRSVSNQRIKVWWGFLRRSETDWWINFFEDLRNTGLLNDSDLVQAEWAFQISTYKVSRIYWRLHLVRI